MKRLKPIRYPTISDYLPYLMRKEFFTRIMTPRPKPKTWYRRILDKIFNDRLPTIGGKI